jgi:hypothetical protein
MNAHYHLFPVSCQAADRNDGVIGYDPGKYAKSGEQIAHRRRNGLGSVFEMTI